MHGTHEDMKAALREAFPGWSIIRSDRGRWWAMRGPLVEPFMCSDQGDVSADSAEELAVCLRAVEARERKPKRALIVGQSGRSLSGPDGI